MSLNQMLNSGHQGGSKPQPPVVRHVLTRKIENSPKQIQTRQVVQCIQLPTNPTQPVTHVSIQNQQIPQQTTQNQHLENNLMNRPLNQQNQLSNDEIMIFNFMVKLLLPKDRLEKINLLFQKLLLGKLSFITISKSISNHLEICPVLLKVWENILNRNMNISNPIYIKLSEIIAYFRINNLSTAVLCNYIATISSAKQHSTPSIYLIEKLISNFGVFDKLNVHSKILQYSLDLLHLLPKPPHQLRSTIDAPQNKPTFSEVLTEPYKEKPFSIYPRYNDLSTFMMRNSKVKEHSTHRHVSARDTTYTPSHHQHQIPIIEEQPCFFLNYFTKSLHSGHEGGSRGHDNRHTEIPIPTTRDIHDVLEQPEICEHEIDAILSFGPETNYIGHIAAVACKTVYDDQTWNTIINYLKSPGARKYVSNQCRKRLLQIENAHREACTLCDIFLSTRPINKFLNSLRIPETIEGFSFLYFNTSLEVSEYSKSVFKLYTFNRYPDLPFFFRNFYPFLSGEDMYMQIIFPKSGVMALYYYGLLCESLEPLLSREASSFDTYEACFDIACEEVHEKFPDGESALPHRFLSSVLQSITKNGTVLDDVSYDVYKHFGIKSTCVAKIASILSHLNAACHSLSAEPHWNEMKKMAQMLGTAKDQQTLDARFLLYSEKMKFPSCEHMYIMKNNPNERLISVTLNQ